MSQALRVNDRYACVDRWHAGDGAALGPGQRILDIIGPDGTTRTLVSETWGILVISDRNANRYDETDMAVPAAGNDDAPIRRRKLSTRPAAEWGIAAHTAGLTSFYGGYDEICAEKHFSAVSFGDPDHECSKVYSEGDFLCQIMPHDKRGSVKAATPHPSTSRSVSMAKEAGRLLPTFG